MKKTLWVLTLLLLPHLLKADVALSNLGGSIDGGSALNEPTPFTVDSSYWDLTKLTIEVYSFEGEPATIGLSLYSDAGGKPGAFLASLGSQDLPLLALEVPNFPVDVSFPQQTPITLDPNATYWISGSGSGPGGDTTGWYATTDNAATGLPGWSLGETEYYNNGTWNSIGGGNETYMMSLEVTPTPEPATWALFSLITVSFGIRRFWKKC